MAALIVTWFAFCSEPNNEIILCANDKDQASWVIFNKIKYAIENNPLLLGSATILKDEIKINATNTIIRVIAQDYRSGAGLNPGLVVFDELWAYDSDTAEKFFDELTTVPTRAEPLTLIVTYAGFEGDSLLYRLYERGLSKKDPKMFFYWSNENKSSWVKKEYLQTQKLRLKPNVFLRLHCNQFTSSEASFINIDDWDLCVDSTVEPLFESKEIPIYVGVDIGIKKDGSAVVSTYKKDGFVYLAKNKAWRPKRDCFVDIEKDIEPYLLYLLENYNVVKIACDPYQFTRTITSFKDKGYPIEEFPQSDKLMIPASENLYELISSHRLKMYPNKSIRQEALNAIAKEKPRGIKITKTKSSDKIDQIIALAISTYFSSKDFYSKAFGMFVQPEDNWYMANMEEELKQLSGY